MIETHPARRAEVSECLEQLGAPKRAARMAACCEFGSGLRCDATSCGQTRIAVPRYCRLRTCPVCAPLDSIRLRRRWSRRFRYVAETQARPGYRTMLVTLTFKTLPAVLARLERNAKGTLFSPFARWSFGVANRFLRELYPGDVQAPVEGAGKRARRRRRGAGGLSTFEVGAGGHAHAHALVHGRWYSKREELGPWWKERAAYRGCAACGAFRPGRREAVCGTAGCARQGQPLELVESYVLDIRATRGRDAEPLEYVLKYVTKAGDGTSAARGAHLELLLGSVHRIRAWGALMGIPERELEAAGYGDKDREPLACPDCGGKLHREESMSSRTLALRTLLASGYELAETLRRRLREARAG